MTNKRENKSQNFKNNLVLSPLRIIAQLATISALISLLFEVKFFYQYSEEVYITRLAAAALAFLVLFFSSLRIGERHPIILLYILIFSILASNGIIAFLIPNTIVFNSLIIGLILFTSVLILNFEIKHQIVIVILYNLLFAAAVILNEEAFYFIPGRLEAYSFTIFLSVMALVASMLNIKSKLAFRESKVSAPSIQDSPQENIYKNILDNSLEGIFRIKHDGSFIYYNDAVAKIFEIVNENDLLQFNFVKFVVADEEWKNLISLLEKQGKVKNFRMRIKTAQENEINVKLSVKGFSEETEKIIEGNIQDITQQVKFENERKVLVEELKKQKLEATESANAAVEASKIKTQFLANMSHEIRTPMNSVLGFLTLIENGLFENSDELKEFAGNAKMSAESLLDIINNILDISKIEAGKMELDESPFSIYDEIEKAVSIISPSVKEKGITLKQQIDKSIPHTVIGDATRFRQILVNLLGNAIKFTDEGTIEVFARATLIDEGLINLETAVTDSGPGISPEKLSQLFKPYARVKEIKGNQKQGAGLGLLISKEFANLMGGDIKVESNVGIGSSFTFNIKLHVAASEIESVKIEKAVEETKHADENSDAKEVVTENETTANFARLPRNLRTKKRLLLVEDNPISQNVELKLLREVGYAVDAVSTGADAIAAANTGKFDLVLMDIELSDMNGITATQKIRQLNNKFANIPIIAVTAHSSMKDRERCLAAGMDDYISKPININFLKMTIDQWLKLKSLED